MLFSELNDSKNELFSKSFTYAAESNIAVSFNNQSWLNGSNEFDIFVKVMIGTRVIKLMDSTSLGS